jgi:hypothetical protein
MKIELRKVKHSPALSRETNAYSAKWDAARDAQATIPDKGDEE